MPWVPREGGKISFQERDEDRGGNDVEGETIWRGGERELLDGGEEKVVVIKRGRGNVDVRGVGVEEGVWDCYVVNDGDIFVGFAFIWDGGEIVVRKALEDLLKARIIRSCVPVASQDGGRKGEKEVVEVFEGKRVVLVFVNVEEVKVKERGRNGSNKNIGVLGRRGKRGGNRPSLLFPDAGRESFRLLGIVRKGPKIAVR